MFAIQGLMGTIVSPNYAKDVSEVYCKMAPKLITMPYPALPLYSLYFSGIGLNGDLDLVLPSWIPNWQHLAENQPSLMPGQTKVNAGFEIGFRPEMLEWLRPQS